MNELVEAAHERQLTKRSPATAASTSCASMSSDTWSSTAGARETGRGPVRPHPTVIWDYAAAALLLAEAGGWFGSTNGAHVLQERPFAYRADGSPRYADCVSSSSISLGGFPSRYRANAGSDDDRVPRPRAGVGSTGLRLMAPSRPVGMSASRRAPTIAVWATRSSDSSPKSRVGARQEPAIKIAMAWIVEAPRAHPFLQRSPTERYLSPPRSGFASPP